jgi:glycosyltransferase involved in cell wall biosynthesis
LQRAYRPDARVHVVPNGVDVACYDSEPARDRRADAPAIVYPAMFTYAPNARAARFLIDEVMPLLDGSHRLLLVGSMPTPAMLEASRRDERIVVTGAVPDMRPFLQAATAMAVPLFEGSGTRFKILEAFASRVPVVTTSVGADGLDVTPGTHVLMAETAEQFVAALRMLRGEPGVVERLVEHGYDLVKRRYSWDAACGCIARAVADLRASGGAS